MNERDVLQRMTEVSNAQARARRAEIQAQEIADAFLALASWTKTITVVSLLSGIAIGVLFS